MSGDREKLTVARAKQELSSGRDYTIEDFATEEELEELERINGAPRKKAFDGAASVSAEILATFGYDAWMAWQNGHIEAEEMNRYLAAERARQRELLVELEAVLLNLISSTIRKPKGKPIPKGVKMAAKIIKNQQKIINGDRV